MNIKRFNEIMNRLPYRGDLMQDSSEWLGFMEFVSAYFENRGIIKPLVVEIGVYCGAAREFYEQLLGAEYIGIDINPKSPCDIIGDSADPRTIATLKTILRGRKIDLLFIDGDHGYEAVKRDYELYAPQAKHLVVLHDIIARRDGALTSIEVCRFWTELLATENTIVFKGRGWCTPGRQTPIGIGIILKQGWGE